MPKLPDDKTVALIQQATGYHFKNPPLLKRALTHRSASSGHMERLEFLGDAVLGLAIAEYLHEHFPQYTEGELSRMRAALVRKESLMRVATLWQLDHLLIVGEGERKEGRLKSRSIAANGVEALIGAVFQESGWNEARLLIMRAWHPMLEAVDVDAVLDSKSRLQEFTQGRGWGLPDYQVTDHGAGKSPRFSARCSVNGEWLGKGSGNRKKTAELNAADQAWEALGSKQN
ncbi:MAG: ribonuclease III [Mariprofundaceae bacterium]|nr:ribonuclease III [Mariprofundaceae bacterium]